MSSKEAHLFKLYTAIKVSAVFLILMWLGHFLRVYYFPDAYQWGVLPRTFTGLKGIITIPFLHGSWEHLISNTFPMLVLTFFITYFYITIYKKAILSLWIIAGFWLWVIGRNNYHVGASGLVYAYTAFLFFSGLLRRDTVSLTVSLIVIFLYGSIVWGMLPFETADYSWEGHLTGFLAGIAVAIYFRRKNLREKIQISEDDSRNESKYGEDYWKTPEQLAKEGKLPAQDSTPIILTYRYVEKKKEDVVNSAQNSTQPPNTE